MNERHFAGRIREHLDLGLERIDDRHLARLRAARERALAASLAPTTEFAGNAGDAVFRRGEGRLLPRGVLMALALVAAAGIYAYWLGETEVAGISEVDSALLADDIPVEALLDRGFESWLAGTR